MAIIISHTLEESFINWIKNVDLMFHQVSMFVYRVYIASFKAGSRNIRIRTLVRKKLGTFEGTSTISHTKLL
jgi:hypothetical protein